MTSRYENFHRRAAEVPFSIPPGACIISEPFLFQTTSLTTSDFLQARGITMKSSSISLLYVPGAALLPQGPNSCSAEDKQQKGKCFSNLPLAAPQFKFIGSQAFTKPQHVNKICYSS